jgi:acyl-CoA synthetase (AMP-forming)/AMP-acid ligase II
MLDGFVRDWASWTPRAPAVVTPAGAVSYDRLDADVDRLGARLLALGLAPQTGRVVAVAMRSAYLEMVTLAALARIGVASAPGTDAAADAVVTDDLATGGQVLIVGRDVLDAPAAPLPRLDLDLDASGRISLTRGGRRLVQSWRELERANFANLRTWAAGRTGVFLPLGGVESAAGFRHALCGWSCGGAVGVGFAPQDLSALAESQDPGVVILSPAQLADVLAALPRNFRPFAAWRLIVTGAALPPGLAREALFRLTPDIRILYETADCGLVAAGHAADLVETPGAVGVVPTGVEVAIVDDVGRRCAPGDLGEVWVTPWGGAALATGDRGRLHADGRLLLEVSSSP